MSTLYTGTRRFGRTVRSNWRPLFIEVSILLFVLAATFVAILSGIHAARASVTAEYFEKDAVVGVIAVERDSKAVE